MDNSFCFQRAADQTHLDLGGTFNSDLSQSPLTFCYYLMPIMLYLFFHGLFHSQMCALCFQNPLLCDKQAYQDFIFVVNCYS